MRAAPSVFALPPGAEFAADFARGYHARHGDLEMAARARATVMVTTGVAQAGIASALTDLAPRPGILPRVRMIADLAADMDLPAAIDPLRRQLYLTRLVRRFLDVRRDALMAPMPLAAAADLAQSLTVLLDQFHAHGASPDLLSDVDVAGEAAQHWQQALEFVDIVRTNWPQIRKQDEAGGLDPAERQTMAINRLIESWQIDPPAYPVIAAASTGSVGSTAALLAAVARLPQGAIVLPGFDPSVEPEIWAAVTPDHPLGPFRDLFARLEIQPGDVGLWQPAGSDPRRKLMEQAMRPAPVTDHWHKAAPALARIAPDAMAGIDLLEAENPREEAAAIAIAVREVLAEPGATVTVVTADGVLARRVAASLSRFGIVPDDTIGAPLAQAVPGVLMDLLLSAAGPDAGTLEIAALLQHPLVRPGRLRSVHLGFARTYERRVLRGPVQRGELPPDPDAGPDAREWLAEIDATIAPLRGLLSDGAPLATGAAAVRDTLSWLTDPGTGPVIWEDPAGQDLLKFLEDVIAHADALGGADVVDLAALFATLIEGRQLRPRPREAHPRVRICGTREARVEGAGRLILAGLNDGSWPAPADPGPWLSRPMHQAVGLPLPERVVGLAAHDFQQAICRDRVLLTRSLRAEGAPTVASRWLVRLETLLEGIQASDVLMAARCRGARYAALARRMELPDREVPRADRPRPVPPRAAIPRRLPVTQIETLLRDAYAVYARHILHLRPLDPLGRNADVRERGKLLHVVMERFVAATDPWPGPAAARDALLAVADVTLAEHPLPADLRRVWRGRIDRFADWLISQEDGRRASCAPLACERSGEIALDIGGERFTFTARVDRIDRAMDGGGIILDYKSGQPPSDKQIRQRFSQQLHLAGAILQAGGFERVTSMKPVAGAYIGLTGGREGGKETACPDLAGDLPDYLDQLGALFSQYLDGAPWVSRGRPERISFASDYDHLARAAEWSFEDTG